MNELLWTIIMFLIAVLVHELGHYLSYRAFRVKPDIKLTWFGAIMIGGNVYAKLTPIKAYIVSLSGVLWGMPVLAYFGATTELWLVYFLVSGIDLLNMIQLLDIPKKWKDKTLLEISELQIQELKEKYK